MTPYTLTKVRDQLKRDEGWENFPYKDSLGFLTIGVGFNLETGLDNTEIEWILSHRLTTYYHNLLAAFPIVGTLDEARQGALLNMAYQMGIPRLKGFKKMWDSIERGLYEQASLHGLDSKWAKQTPARARRVMQQLRTGEWVQDG